MSTQLFLRVTASELGTTGKLALLTTRGTGSTLATTNTAASGTNIAVTNTAAGTAISWWFRVGAAVTISGGITINLRGMMSNAAANAGAGIWIQRFAPDAVTVGASLLNDITIPVAGATAYAVGTDAAKNIVATPTSVAFAAGDWIKVTLKVRNVGTMAAGYTVVNTYNGATAAAAGDTYVTFTENITPYPVGVLAAELPGPPTAGLVGTQANPGAWAASKLPRLTSQSSGTNNNLAAWAAKLPLLTGQTVDVNVPAVLQSTVDDQGATSDVAQTATLGQLTQGSVIIAVATVASSTLDPVITDDVGLFWSPIPTTVYSATMGKRINFYWARNTSTAAALNVTATYGSAAASRTLSLTEVRGLDPNPNLAPWDNFTGLTNSGGTTSIATSVIRTFTPGEFVFAVAATTGIAAPAATSGGLPVLDTWTADSKILTEYRLVRGTADVTMGVSQAPSGAVAIIAVSFLPAGIHTPQALGGTTWTAGSDGLTLPNPPNRGSAYKLVVWVFVNWADATPRTVDDVTVTGYINAGFIYATDGVTGHALWAGWRDSVGGDAAGVVHAAGAQSITGTTQTISYAVGAPRPSGMPWVAPGPQGATTFGAGGGPVSVPGPVPNDQWGLNHAFINSLTSSPTVVGSPPLNWVQQGSNGSARYLWQAPLGGPSQQTVTVTPSGGAAATVLSGLIDNGVPGVSGTVAARFPLATAVVQGTAVNTGSVAARLPLATAASAGTAANPGAVSGQVASVLTSTLAPTQVVPAVLAAGMPLLRAALSEGNVPGNVIVALPLLQAAVTGALGPVTGTVAAQLPLLTNQTSADNVNRATLSAALPGPLKNLTSAYQAVLGGTISFLPFPLLATALTATQTNPGTFPAKLPLLQSTIVGLAAGAGSLNATLPLLANHTQITQANQASLSGQVGSVPTSAITGVSTTPGVVVAVLPLLTAVLDNSNHAVVNPGLPLLTAQLVATVQVQDAVTGGTFPLMVTALFGTPVIGADLSTAALPLLTTQLTADFVVNGVTAARLPLLRTHLTGHSAGEVFLDVTVSAGPTRQGGMRVGSDNTRTLTLAGAAGTRADTVAAGDTRTGLTAAGTRAERGPR